MFDTRQQSELTVIIEKRNHREHTILLNRKTVNKLLKRTNSLPLSPVVVSYATLQRKPLRVPTSSA